jgi:hypothetical protein
VGSTDRNGWSACINGPFARERPEDESDYGEGVDRQCASPRGLMATFRRRTERTVHSRSSSGRSCRSFWLRWIPGGRRPPHPLSSADRAETSIHTGDPPIPSAAPTTPGLRGHHRAVRQRSRTKGPFTQANQPFPSAPTTTPESTGPKVAPALFRPQTEPNLHAPRRLTNSIGDPAHTWIPEATVGPPSSADRTKIRSCRPTDHFCRCRRLRWIPGGRRPHPPPFRAQTESKVRSCRSSGRECRWLGLGWILGAGGRRRSGGRGALRTTRRAQEAPPVTRLGRLG